MRLTTPTSIPTIIPPAKRSRSSEARPTGQKSHQRIARSDSSNLSPATMTTPSRLA